MALEFLEVSITAGGQIRTSVIRMSSSKLSKTAWPIEFADHTVGMNEIDHATNASGLSLRSLSHNPLVLLILLDLSLENSKSGSLGPLNISAIVLRKTAGFDSFSSSSSFVIGRLRPVLLDRH
jgi:hypothetical protein